MIPIRHTEGLLLMRVEYVSNPFDAGQWCEVKFQVEGPFDVRGELYLRVPAVECNEWMPGDVLGSQLRRL